MAGQFLPATATTGGAIQTATLTAAWVAIDPRPAQGDIWSITLLDAVDASIASYNYTAVAGDTRAIAAINLASAISVNADFEAIADGNLVIVINLNGDSFSLNADVDGFPLSENGSGEVQVLVNGREVGHAPTTSNEQWGPPRTMVIPELLVNDAATAKAPGVSMSILVANAVDGTRPANASKTRPSTNTAETLYVNAKAPMLPPVRSNPPNGIGRRVAATQISAARTVIAPITTPVTKPADRSKSKVACDTAEPTEPVRSESPHHPLRS